MKRIVISTLFLITACCCFGKVKLPLVLGDNMVLQRNTTVNIWGESSPNTKISVTTSWNNKTYDAISDKQGKWKVGVLTTKEGGPYSISISDGEKLTLGNIMLGEVWICSGQSNMEMPVKGYPGQPVDKSMEAMLESTRYPDIRMFTVGYHSAQEAQSDCKDGKWLTSNPESVGEFSATAYFFGKTLSKVLNIPVGLITTNRGGSAIEAWMSETAIKQTPEIDQNIALSGQEDNSKPAVLFNGMILPIINYTVKGFIWYQGESNRHNPYDYPALMASMIGEWRTLWHDNKMPFYYAQIAPYCYEWNTDGFEQPMIVEAQYKALKIIPYSGIAATTDIGHTSCIHPPQKSIVGERIALHALSKDYGIKGLIADPPMFGSMYREDNKLVLVFSNLMKPSGNNASNSFSYFDTKQTTVIKGFEIAGADRVFYPAKADFKWGTDDIMVYSDSVTEPVAVRYAFRNIPDANIMTVSGLPLPSFRTDDWPVEVAPSH